ncbi:LodA/GoxA family CTQ-dependent oxidase [Rhodococcus koreensis]
MPRSEWARVGNVPESDLFIGPERPNQHSAGSGDAGTVVPPFKSGCLVKRQAARFRIWEYVENDGRGHRRARCRNSTTTLSA